MSYESAWSVSLSGWKYREVRNLYGWHAEQVDPEGRRRRSLHDYRDRGELVGALSFGTHEWGDWDK